MRARPCLILLCALLIPAASFAAEIIVLEGGDVRKTTASDPDDEDYEAAKNATVQGICPIEDGKTFPLNIQANDEGELLEFSVPTGPCQIRVITEELETSTVASIYFDSDAKRLKLFLQRQDDDVWYLHGFVK